MLQGSRAMACRLTNDLLSLISLDAQLPAEGQVAIAFIHPDNNAEKRLCSVIISYIRYPYFH